MNYRFTILSILLLFSVVAGAQNITGIWKGYFIQKSMGFYEDRYKFELQIEQLPNSGINGVTYSYKTTVFYGKADIKGKYTSKTKNVVITETKLTEVKIGDKSEPCLMTCYLDYSKMGSLETLTGTYTSKNIKEGTDCGNGRVYLEKTTETDFYKEDFLVKRENELKRKSGTAKKTPFKPAPKNLPPVKKPILKPGAEENLVKAPPLPPLNKAPEPVRQPKRDSIKTPSPTAKLPRPEMLRKRTNELTKTIYTTSKEIRIDLYDNGEIDGDTITVYHNNQLIVSHKMLTDKPISFTIKADENSPFHEFVMVADNLGSIPPNTALMVITAGNKRHEVFLTSTEQKNASVVIEYRAAD